MAMFSLDTLRPRVGSGRPEYEASVIGASLYPAQRSYCVG